jgi:lipoprotein-anchoring transpeptidase ErfK/SrfK
MKRRWPRWLQPKEMAVRHEKAAKWTNGMPGGSENP